MTISEIQTAIFEQTGLKTTVKSNRGSMKHHVTVKPLFQGGAYPNFPHEWVREFGKQFKSFGHGVFCTVSSLEIPLPNFTDITPIKYKKERKPKHIDPDTPMAGWGSANSQLRLDKATSRYAKHLKKGNCARYY
jgi:hypothetical protein